jgi:hypothetical protein
LPLLDPSELQAFPGVGISSSCSYEIIGTG